MYICIVLLTRKCVFIPCFGSWSIISSALASTNRCLLLLFFITLKPRVE